MEHVAITTFAEPEPPASPAPWCHPPPQHTHPTHPHHPGGWGSLSGVCCGDTQLLLGPLRDWGPPTQRCPLPARASRVCSAWQAGAAATPHSWDGAAIQTMETGAGVWEQHSWTGVTFSTVLTSSPSPASLPLRSSSTGDPSTQRSFIKSQKTAAIKHTARRAGLSPH